MKKIFLFATTAAVLLSSCSKNEVTENLNNPANAIGFNTYVGSATKASVETDFTDSDVFTIDAYYTADKALAEATTIDPFMQDQKVEATVTTEGETSTTAWGYSPIKYWPNNTGDKVSFFAVTDATGTAYPFNTLEDKAPSFTVSDATTDIMIASVLNKTKPLDGIVAFNFQHTMSQLKFTVKLAEALTVNSVTDDKTEVKITSLKVNYGDVAYKGGTFTFKNNEENKGEWELSTSTTTRAADEFTSGPGIATALGVDPIDLGTPIMAIPFTGANYEVTLTYTVTTTDKDNDANKSEITNICTFNIEPEQMNTVYTYNLSLNLSEVDVTGDIADDWGEEISNTYIINSKTQKQ